MPRRKRDLGAFFKSIHGTVDHLIYGDVVTHMFNHATHHRSQLTTLMKQLGVEPGVTDLPWLPALYDRTVLHAPQM